MDDTQARGAEILANASRYARTLCHLSAGLTPDAPEAPLRELQQNLEAFSNWIEGERLFWPRGLYDNELPQ